MSNDTLAAVQTILIINSQIMIEMLHILASEFSEGWLKSNACFVLTCQHRNVKQRKQSGNKIFEFRHHWHNLHSFPRAILKFITRWGAEWKASWQYVKLWEFYATGIFKLEERYEKCLKWEGDYVEK